MEKMKDVGLLKSVWNNLEYILAGICLLLICIVLFLQVIFRFVLNNPIGWTEELAVTLFVMMVYIGSIGATRNDEHMKLELFINMFGPRGRLVMLIIGNMVFFAANLIIVYAVTVVAMNLKKYGMTTAMLGIPKWIPYMVLPVCFVMMDIRLAQDTVRKIKKIQELSAEKKTSEERKDS